MAYFRCSCLSIRRLTDFYNYLKNRTHRRFFYCRCFSPWSWWRILSSRKTAWMSADSFCYCSGSLISCRSARYSGRIRDAGRKRWICFFLISSHPVKAWLSCLWAANNRDKSFCFFRSCRLNRSSICLLLSRFFPCLNHQRYPFRSCVSRYEMFSSEKQPVFHLAHAAKTGI